MIEKETPRNVEKRRDNLAKKKIEALSNIEGENKPQLEVETGM